MVIFTNLVEAVRLTNLHSDILIIGLNRLQPVINNWIKLKLLRKEKLCGLILWRDIKLTDLFISTPSYLVIVQGSFKSCVIDKINGR